MLHTRNFASWFEALGRTSTRGHSGHFQVRQPYSYMACEAAKRLGIHTFVIPHAGTGRYHKDVLYGDSILYGADYRELITERSGMPSSRLVGCKGLLARNEYPVKPLKAFSSDSKWRVLVLVEPTGEGPHFDQTCSPARSWRLFGRS